MNKHRLLQVLVVADILLAFASVGAEGFFGWTLPRPLAEYNHARFSRFPHSSVGGLVRLFLLATTVLCSFVAWIGLLRYWRFGRRLYLASLGFSMLLILASGPSVTVSLSAMFRAMNGLVGGAILGLVYFSDLAHRFERPAAERAAPAAMDIVPDRA